MNFFLHDLNQAYTTGQLLYDDNTNLRYFDYAVIEQQMSMTGASMFWLDVLHDCKLDQSLSLPFDRYRLSNEYRTGRGTSISFDFGQDLSHDFLIDASSNNISLEHLALTTYYVFLFKLTNGERDLCIGINTHGRYRNELSFQHDLNLNEFSCTINASLDLFHAETVSLITQRLQTMLHQQFISFHCKTNKPIYELSLILSNEQYLMQSVNNTRTTFSSPLTCIHHEFVYQVTKHPQKLAVELDEQSLTYCELLYYVQILSLTLLNEYCIIPGEIVYQCVERSLSMVS
ncbi:unnamed protein product [Adineta steineri]|uniref:Condensation domain-containing protein n=1 Tax=Adineta steineri TaxID=433720 RepID=A0A819FUI3_9BILA|nr:unnamed protein product [Adineta steineri]CAF3874183.1 unnamed protein product [Adineta steineri]